MKVRARIEHEHTIRKQASSAVIVDQSAKTSETKNELKYAPTTGYVQLKKHFSRPVKDWLTYPMNVENTVHRSNHYTLTIVLFTTVYLGYNDKGFRGDLCDPIVISQLVYLLVAPPVISPLYWMSEWITIPALLRPYHQLMTLLQRAWPESSVITNMLSLSVFTSKFERDEAGIRLTYLLVVLWGLPFWICDANFIHTGPGTASFGFTAIGISGIGISLLDTCLGNRCPFQYGYLYVNEDRMCRV